MLADTEYDFWTPKNPTNYPGGRVSLHDDPAYPDYCADHGQFAFRHPYGKRGNYLFFDNHVELLTPNDNVESNFRLRISQ